MKLKELLRISVFENYSIEIEGEKEIYLVNKDEAFERFGLMYVTEIDYAIIFVHKENCNNQEDIALSLLVIDKDKVYN